MSEAFIVDAVRTAGGRRGGRLSGIHPVDLGAEVVNALVARSGIDPDEVEDLILGCVDQGGEQSQNLARNVVLASSLPERVPGVSIDRQCGSSQQALHFAAQAVMSGCMDAVIAAGVESMSRVPMFSPSILAEKAGMGVYVSPRMEARYPGVRFSQFTGAELVAAKHKISKERMEAFSLDSHRKAAAATQGGRFAAELVPVKVNLPDGSNETHIVDEGIRFDASLEAIAQVKPIIEGGQISPATASQICDGASALLVVNEVGLKRLNVEPLARVHQLTVFGHDPVTMLEAPLPATDTALSKAGLTIDDIDLFEINEAFASIPLAWLDHTRADPARLNVNGGAIALGHPLGATGAKLMATLAHELKRRRGRFGLQAMCEGGGLANVTIIERL